MVMEQDLEGLQIAADLALGAFAGAQGELEQQLAAFDRVLKLLPIRCRPTTVTQHQQTIAQSLVDSGQYQEAMKILSVALSQARSDQTAAFEADLMVEIGRSWEGMGDWAKAAEIYAEGVEIAEKFPAERREAGLLHRLGAVRDRLGDKRGAQVAWGRALVLYERVADPKADEVRKLLGGVGVGGGVN